MSINIINDSNIRRGICFYLQDRVMRILGTTCKKMQLIAQQELKERDEQLSQILSSYAISRKFNVRTLEEVNLFCLAEIHNSLQCRLDQSKLINFLTWRGFIVLLLVEGWPSMKTFNEEEKDSLIEQRLWNLASKNKIYGLGWDDQEQLDALKAKIDQEYEEQNDKLEEHERHALQKAMKCLPKNMLPTEEEFSEIEKQSLSFHEIFNATMKAIEIKISPNLSQLSAVAQKNYLSIYGLDMKLCEFYANIEETKRVREAAAIEQTFPIRTLAMTNTLKKIDHFLSNLGFRHIKVVLTGGARHLESNEGDLKKVETDLNVLYEELNNHKAVILLPSNVISAHETALKELKKTLEE